MTDLNIVMFIIFGVYPGIAAIRILIVNSRKIFKITKEMY